MNLQPQSGTSGTLNDEVEFVDWSTGTKNTGTHYKPGGTFSLNANTTLYANWRINYVPLTITIMSLDRANSSGTVDDGGTYAVADLVIDIYRGGTTNEKYGTVDVERSSNALNTLGAYPTSNGTNAYTMTTLSSTGPVDLGNGRVRYTRRVLVGGGSFSTENAYTVYFIANDTESSEGYVWATDSITPASFPMDFYREGVGVSFGGAASRAGFKSYWKGLFANGMQVGHSTNIPGQMPSLSYSVLSWSFAAVRDEVTSDEIWTFASNNHTANSIGTLTLTVTGVTGFGFWVSSNGENNYDYVRVMPLNTAAPTSWSAGSDSDAYYSFRGKSLANASYVCNPQDPEGSKMTWIYFSGMTSTTQYTINICYGKDGSADSFTDSGYVVIPLQQFALKVSGLFSVDNYLDRYVNQTVPHYISINTYINNGCYDTGMTLAGTSETNGYVGYQAVNLTASDNSKTLTAIDMLVGGNGECGLFANQMSFDKSSKRVRRSASKGWVIKWDGTTKAGQLFDAAISATSLAWYTSVSLTSQVSGILPRANGGTGITDMGYSGSNTNGTDYTAAAASTWYTATTLTVPAGTGFLIGSVTIHCGATAGAGYVYLTSSTLSQVKSDDPSYQTLATGLNSAIYVSEGTNRLRKVMVFTRYNNKTDTPYYLHYKSISTATVYRGGGLRYIKLGPAI